MNMRKKLVVTLLALVIAIGFGQPTSADHVDCFSCEYVDISDPAEGGGPDIRATCFSWGDAFGWSQCQEIGHTCFFLVSCTLFDF